VKNALLIFPAGYGDAPDVRAHAATLGLRVVGASSRSDDPERGRYQDWVRLPHVSDPGFDKALAEAITAHGIGQVHASHYAAWRHLQSALPTIAPDVALHVGKNNFDLVADYRARKERLAAIPPIPELAAASAPRPPLNAAERSGFLRAAMAIPGESYEPKLLAMIEAARRAPQGDIVEIGCLFGRTAALLAMLANQYDLGNVLCVDPWSIQSTEQGNAQLRDASAGFAWTSFRDIFEINVAPFARGRLNYIHAPSLEGAARYAETREARSEAFGRTAYQGEIGLLHIDGNHEYEHVRADCERWTPWVKPGGWIIFDDYVWDWGDGPARVADAYLAREGAKVRAAFVVGGAMFVQRAGG
jgi:SAM-dependent methyltransferase